MGLVPHEYHASANQCVMSVGTGDEGNTPKSNMDDLSFFEEDQISTLCRTAGIAQILQ